MLSSYQLLLAHIEYNILHIVLHCEAATVFILPNMVELQKFNLCWNEFDKAASATLKNLVEDHNFTDVTISCDDDDTILAHKIVLGSSSPVFR